MNNKGFTLVELLATIVILGIVLGIVSVSVIGIINKTKEKSEEIFVKNIGSSVQSYISTNRLKWSRSSTPLGTFKKCNRVNASGACLTRGKNVKYETKELYSVSGGVLNNSSFSLKELISGNYIESNKIINPKNKLDCMKDNSNILYAYIYKDEDSVYYYYVDMSNSSCEVSEKNAIVTNITKNVCKALDGKYTWEEDVCKKND